MENFIENNIGILTIIFCILLFGGLIAIIGVRWETSEQNVSGIVYNTRNSEFISGNTSFRIRAGENTPTTPENVSSFCLPPNSEYIELINKAAADKRVKVNITTKKGFWYLAPWKCTPNVIVTEVK